MSIATPFDSRFYSGGGVSNLVPSLYPVAIDGRPYLVDLKSGNFKRQSIQVLRQQADTSNLPGEASINPEDLWRRSMESWHHGQGQVWLDKPDSDATRYRASKGIDPWTKWQMSLLNDVEQKLPTTTNASQNVVSSGTLFYWADGQTLRRTADPTPTAPTWTTITGLPAANILGLASDGYNTYIAMGASGLWFVNNGATAATQYVTGNVGGVAYVKERLMIFGMGVDKHRIWNPTSIATATTGATGIWPDPLKSHRNVDFTWVAFAEGQGSIYAAGYSGDKSLIYRTTVRNDGTSLDFPVVASELPDGEIIQSMQGYLGFVVIGTTTGVRFATADSQGNLTLGSLIRTGAPVVAFEPQDRFVWFNWNNYDGLSTGLGRLDLTSFVAPLTPAYASDLMLTGQGSITSIATFGNKRYFTAGTIGLVGQIDDVVASGTIDSGRIMYGIPDTKVAMYLQVRHLALTGAVTLGISVDDNPLLSLGQNVTAGQTLTSLPVGQLSGGRFEVRITLARTGGGYGAGYLTGYGATLSTFITRMTLRAYPGPARGEIFVVPLMFYEILSVGDQEEFMSPLTELNAIRSMVTDHRLVTYQEADVQRAVFVEDYEWTPTSPTQDGTFWNGICVVKLKSVSEI